MIVSGRRIAIAEWKGTSDRSQTNRKRSALGGFWHSDADVAHFDEGQQARERRFLDYRAD